MVIKTVRMGIPILVSRSGFTAWGVDLARQVGLTLVGRARGKRFIALSGAGAHRLRPEPRLMSRKNRRGTSARAKSDDDEIPPTPGVLLAGGLARRMGGGDKPMRTIGGRTILERVIARLQPQCDGLILNANGDPGALRRLRPAGRRRQRAGFSRTARRHSCRARLGRREPARVSTGC